MVQRKLLMAHSGSIHGGEETPGGRPSLRQGAGKRSVGAPDLGSAAAAERRRDREKGFLFQRFPVTENIYRRKEGSRGPPGVQAAPWRGPTLGRAGRALGALVGPLWAPLGDSGSFLIADFLLEFSRIFGELFIWGKSEIEKQQKTGT